MSWGVSAQRAIDMKTIAIIDQDTADVAALRQRLAQEGFRVIHVTHGSEAISVCLREKADLIVLDAQLQDMDGFELCKALRENPKLCDTPIVFLTGRDSECDRLIGLSLGARDYILKPFYVSEVIARIKNSFRMTADMSPYLKAGVLEMDRRSRQVKIGDKKVPLTATEYALLEFLMNHPGVVFTRSQLLDAVWGNARVVTERTVDVFMLRLRRKLGCSEASAQYLSSVRGFGYRFDPDMVAAPVMAREKNAGRLRRVK